MTRKNQSRISTKSLSSEQLEAIQDIREGFLSRWIALDNQRFSVLIGKKKTTHVVDEDDLEMSLLPDEPPFGYGEPERFE